MKSVLITGASGYIGSFVVKEFLAEGYEVLGLRSRSRAIQDSKLGTSAGPNWISCDLLKAFPLEALQKCQGIIHLATPRNPLNKDQTSSRALYRLNVEVLFDILENLKASQRFLYASTGDVVMRSEREALETDIPTEPQSFYGATKAMGEILINAHSKSSQCAIARIFHPMGGDTRFLVNRLVNKIKEGSEIQIEGREGIFVSPIWIEDLARGIRLAYESPKNGTFHLSGGELVGLRNLLEESAKLLGVKLKIKELPETHLKFRGSTAYLSQKNLNFKAQVSLNEALKRIVQE